MFLLCILNFQVAKYEDPRDACAAIVAESYRLWLQYETRTDDITVIVVHINGLTDVRTYSLAFPRNSLFMLFSIIGGCLMEYSYLLLRLPLAN